MQQKKLICGFYSPNLSTCCFKKILYWYQYKNIFKLVNEFCIFFLWKRNKNLQKKTSINLLLHSVFAIVYSFFLFQLNRFISEFISFILNSFLNSQNSKKKIYLVQICAVIKYDLFDCVWIGMDTKCGTIQNVNLDNISINFLTLKLHNLYPLKKLEYFITEN